MADAGETAEDGGRGGHHRKLENLYHGAPVTAWYGARVSIGEGTAEVTIPVREEFFHAAGAVHGSVYFRALDDAAFFAVNSVVDEFLHLTTSFHIHLLRPVDGGEMRAVGRVVHRAGRSLVGAAELFDDGGELLGTGSGSFTRSRVRLGPEVGYR